MHKRFVFAINKPSSNQQQLDAVHSLGHWIVKCQFYASRKTLNARHDSLVINDLFRICSFGLSLVLFSHHKIINMIFFMFYLRLLTACPAKRPRQIAMRGRLTVISQR